MKIVGVVIESDISGKSERYAVINYVEPDSENWYFYNLAPRPIKHPNVVRLLQTLIKSLKENE